jgi:hypothetical protein
MNFCLTRSFKHWRLSEIRPIVEYRELISARHERVPDFGDQLSGCSSAALGRVHPLRFSEFSGAMDGTMAPWFIWSYHTPLYARLGGPLAVFFGARY